MSRSNRYNAPFEQNLKGKKTKLLSCGCCIAINRKDCILKRIQLEEMRRLS